MTTPLTSIWSILPKIKRVSWVMLLILGAILPFLVDSYILRSFSVFYVYLLLAIGLSVVVTYAGLLDLGYIAFFAVGAYTYGLLNKAVGLPFFAALPIGMLTASAFGLLLGFPTLRVRGDYLALVTLGFGEIIRVLLVNIWGPQGIAGIAPPLSAALVGGFDNLYILFYFVALIPVPIAILLLARVDRSRMAKIWIAIRDNEIAAKSCGINSVLWLLLAFAIGTAFAGTAGVIFAGIQRYINPSSFVLGESIFILSIVVIAGSRSLWRLILAAGILSFLPEILRGFADYRMLIYGVLLTSFVIFEEKFTNRFRKKSFLDNGQDINASLRDRVQKLPAMLQQNIPPIWVIKIDHLMMCFGGITALDDVSFTLSLHGNVIGLIGPNGAGKSTLFDCLSGMTRPTSGGISLPGVHSPYPAHASARAGVGRTFQTPQLFHTLTVRENITAGTIRHSAKPDKANELINGIIEYLGLQGVAETNITLLPLGIQRLTELGRALALRPKVILVDEIASGLNSSEKQHMAGLIQHLSSEAGISFLMVEHDMDFVFPLASEVLVLDTGKLIARGTPFEVANNQIVIDAYLGRAHEAA